MQSDIEQFATVARRGALPWRAGLFLVMIAVCAASANTSAQTKQLRLASTPWPPFTNVSGQARFAVDLVQSALERVGIAADTTIVPEGTLTAALLAGRFDGSAALWRDDEREKRLIYSRAYLENRLLLVGRRGSDVSMTTLVGLPLKRIALVEGYAYGEVVRKATGPTYLPAKTVEDSLQMVLSNEADYTLMDQLVVEFLLRNYPSEVRTRLALGTVPLLVRTLHFAVRRDLADAQSIIDRFNAELPRMIADRSYHRLLQVEWIDADVDGDGRLESIPASDTAGQTPPDHRYQLLSPTTASSQPTATPRFYIGGQVYDSWANIPQQYKIASATRTPWGATVAPVFTFKW